MNRSDPTVGDQHFCSCGPKMLLGLNVITISVSLFYVLFLVLSLFVIVTLNDTDLSQEIEKRKRTSVEM